MSWTSDVIKYTKDLLLMADTVRALQDEVDKSSETMVKMGEEYQQQFMELRERIATLEGQLDGAAKAAILIQSAGTQRSKGNSGRLKQIPDDDGAPGE